MKLAAILFAVAFARSSAQAPAEPKPVFLGFGDLRLMMAPDVEGVYLYVKSGFSEAETRAYMTPLDPAQALGWVADARTFLDHPPAATDTGAARISEVLTGSHGGKIYLARRREKKNWSNDRLMILLPVNARAQAVVIKTDEKTVREILDSLEAVSRRAPAPQELVLRDTNGDSVRFDKPASVKPGQAPFFPDRERMQRLDGLVLLRFVVGVDGRVDLPTINVIFASTPGFLESTLEAMTRIRYNPATLQGRPVRQMVTMPFYFALPR